MTTESSCNKRGYMFIIRVSEEKFENPFIQAPILLHYPDFSKLLYKAASIMAIAFQVSDVPQGPFVFIYYWGFF